jgi:hypothetical protein
VIARNSASGDSHIAIIAKARREPWLSKESASRLSSLTRDWPRIQWQAAGFLAMRRIAVAQAPGGIKITRRTHKAHRASNAMFPLFNIFVVMSPLEQKESLSA